MEPSEARSRIVRLAAERYEGLAQGVEPGSPYMVRLESALEQAKADYVTGAVVEIARLRDELAVTGSRGASATG